MLSPKGFVSFSSSQAKIEAHEYNENSPTAEAIQVLMDMSHMRHHPDVDESLDAGEQPTEDDIIGLVSHNDVEEEDSEDEDNSEVLPENVPTVKKALQLGCSKAFEQARH